MELSNKWSLTRASEVAKHWPCIYFKWKLLNIVLFIGMSIGYVCIIYPNSIYYCLRNMLLLFLLWLSLSFHALVFPSCFLF